MKQGDTNEGLVMPTILGMHNIKFLNLSALSISASTVERVASSGSKAEATSNVKREEESRCIIWPLGSFFVMGGDPPSSDCAPSSHPSIISSCLI